METQPELRKEIREHVASLVEAMDAELENEMDVLCSWWAGVNSIEAPVHCTPAATSKPGQFPLSTATSRPD